IQQSQPQVGDSPQAMVACLLFLQLVKSIYDFQMFPVSYNHTRFPVDLDPILLRFLEGLP
ncbi:MAG: hypothetical protein WBI79_08695, partial [Kiritimatiellia bacterium]